MTVSIFRGQRVLGTAFSRFRRLSDEVKEDDDEEEDFEPHVMSTDEIMHKYWKLVVSVFF